MVQLNVLIVGTTPAETLLIEEALNTAGCLKSFRYVGLEQAMDRIPDWQEWDLLIARYIESTGSALLSLLAPVLRQSSPPVMFLVDHFEPLCVARLLNAGALRVLPVEGLEQALYINLSAVTGASLGQVPIIAQGAGNGKTHGITVVPTGKFLIPDQGFVRLFRFSPIGICINRLRDSVCVDCNESFACLLEWPREALLGRTLPELEIPLEIKLLLVDHGELAVSSGRANLQFERKIYTNGRQIRHIQVHLDLIEWDGEECYLALVQDITEKEQVKDKIKRSE
jgi:PAS domain S-box-containing protein